MARKSLDTIMAEAYAEEGLEPEDILADLGAFSTGNLAFDHILGCGGFPRGRTVELAGPPGSGKTTSAAQAAAQAQARGETVVYMDFEQALDEPYLQALGVQTRHPEDPRKHHSLFKPYPAGSLEAGMETAHRAVRTGEVGVLVFDSVAAMIPRRFVEEPGVERTLAMERARILGNELASLNPLLARHHTAAIFLNHVRDVIETGPTRPGMPKQTTTTGGSGLKFYASVRCEFKSEQKFNRERWDELSGETIKEPHAVKTRVKVTKNKLAPPFRTAPLYLEFGRGFNDAWSALSVLVANKLVTKSGAYYYFPESLYHPQMRSGNDKGASIQGTQAILDLARMDQGWADKLARAARQALMAVTADPTEPVPDTVAEVGESQASGQPEPEGSEDAAEPGEFASEEQTVSSGRVRRFV